MKQISGIYFLVFILVIHRVKAQDIHQQPLSQQMAATAMHLWPDSFTVKPGQPAKWSYEQGVMLRGIESIWNATGDGKWFSYIQKCIDFYVQEDGSIKGYIPDEYNLDQINNGKLILLLYRVTGKDKYRKAAVLLRNQLNTHPRTSEGGFWHKKIYPHQMWLDGLYMCEPFYAEFVNLFQVDTAFTDITRQFMLVEKYTRDVKTGLLFHAWDESKKQKWANQLNGRSPHIWGRALGWYGMALVDALDYFPPKHWGRDRMINILKRLVKAATQVQDKKTGLWFDVPDKPNGIKNYVEASASSMLVYTLAKGVRMGYLPAKYLISASRGYEGIKKKFIMIENGQTNLYGTVSESGLGGKPYKDGSFSDYMSVPVVKNDPTGIGAFINAAIEIEMIPHLNKGKGKTVLLDYYYNDEWKVDPMGKKVRYHYTWDDKSNSGFSMLGNVFGEYGMKTNFLEIAPTASMLQKTSVYIIVDPDTENETNVPNLMNNLDADIIANWVRAGGILILMANDSGNAELKNFNKLSSRFGILFHEDHFNFVQGNQFDQGAIQIPTRHPIFKLSSKIFIKEMATLQITKPATSVLGKDGKILMAVANYGKGAVLAIGDPWLYNEYVDGRKLPEVFDNYKAARDLVEWTIAQRKTNSK